jgi:hypothetical protein
VQIERAGHAGSLLSGCSEVSKCVRSIRSRASSSGSRPSRTGVSAKWSIGQAQSVIGDRIAINFEHAGKRLVNAVLTKIELVEDEPFAART